MISDKQSPRLVRRQLASAEKTIDAKRAALANTTGKSQKSRLKREITELERRISEYNLWLARH